MKTFIQYLNESYLAEDKTAMIKKLALPDIEDDEEKDKYKSSLIDFFKSHSNYENKIDWNKSKTLTKKDFETIIKSAKNSKSAQKKQVKAEIGSDIKNIFKSVGNRKFKIVGENDKWLFVAPLTYEAAVYCDSSENQGAGAKWCIGYEKDKSYWNSYVGKGSVFVMAFNKNYKNLSSTDKQSKLKFMIQRDQNYNYHVWNQEDTDTGSDLNVFGNYEKIVENMFKMAETELWKEQGIKQSIIGRKKILIFNDAIDCSYNQLTSLEGSPAEVGGDFRCGGNKLTSLEGAPSKVGGGFECGRNQLTSLEGAPSEVKGKFGCSENKLTSLKGCPSKIGGGFYCSYNQLTSLEGCPSEVGRDFHCSYNQLTSLEGSPAEVGGDFRCGGNKLTSLNGAPSEVGGGFDCSENKLTSLKGCPSEVGWGFYCWSNKLTSLEGAPSKVGGDFDCFNNQLTDEQVSAYRTFLKMTPEEQKATGLLDDTGHYNPKE